MRTYQVYRKLWLLTMTETARWLDSRTNYSFTFHWRQHSHFPFTQSGQKENTVTEIQLMNAIWLLSVNNPRLINYTNGINRSEHANIFSHSNSLIQSTLITHSWIYFEYFHSTSFCSVVTSDNKKAYLQTSSSSDRSLIFERATF